MFSVNLFCYFYVLCFFVGIIILLMFVFVVDIIGVMGGWVVSMLGFGFDFMIYL